MKLLKCVDMQCILEIEDNRNKGYGAEVLDLLLDYGFNYLNLNNIMLNVKSFNERAIACYKKVGFKEFGRRRESYFLNGKYYDDIQFELLKTIKTIVTIHGL